MQHRLAYHPNTDTKIPPSHGGNPDQLDESGAFAGMPECNCSSHGWRVLHENALLLTFGASKVRRFAIKTQ
jgi:hypothetical protein